MKAVYVLRTVYIDADELYPVYTLNTEDDGWCRKDYTVCLSVEKLAEYEHVTEEFFRIQSEIKELIERSLD